jgi:hypothetical protein
MRVTPRGHYSTAAAREDTRLSVAAGAPFLIASAPGARAPVCDVSDCRPMRPDMNQVKLVILSAVLWALVIFAILAFLRGQ